MGEWMLSVMVMTLAFRSLAYSSAFSVRIEYRGKLMPMSTSSWLIRSICSKISLALLVRMHRTSSMTRFK